VDLSRKPGPIRARKRRPNRRVEATNVAVRRLRAVVLVTGRIVVETGKVERPGPMGLCSFVIELAKGSDPKVERIRRRIVLIFALRAVPEPLSLRAWSHWISN